MHYVEVPLQQYTSVWVCSECAAVVVNRLAHDAWHEHLAASDG